MREVWSCQLTHDGQDDNHEVEDVPANGEVVVAQGEHLEHTLPCEDDDEDHVDVVQDVHLELALVIRLHHHGNHVKADEDHDGDVKHLLCHEVIHHALDLVLQWDSTGTGDMGLRDMVKTQAGWE